MFLLRNHSNNLLILILFFFPAGALSAQSHLMDFQFMKIGEIRIEVDTPVEEDFLLSLIELTPHVDILTSSKVRKSIELIYATENFSNIYVDAELVNGKVNLTFILRTVYRMKSIQLKGKKGVSGGKLKRRLPLRKLEPYTPEKILKARDHILSVLRDNGYDNASVTPDVVLQRKERRVEATFHIEAGKRTLVRSLEFRGNSHYNRQQLLSFLKTKPGEPYRIGRFEKDIEELKSRYKKDGFLESKIEVVRTERGAGGIDLGIEIDSGNRLVLTAGGYSFSDKVLRERVPVWTEQSYNNDTLEEGKKNLIDYLQTKGYYDAVVSWTKEIRGNEIHVHYLASPGNRYELKKVFLEGNDHFSEQEIRKLMIIGRKSFLNTRTLESDLEQIISAYRLRGFLFARVPKRDIHRTPDHDIYLELGFDEGPQTFVSEFRIKGNDSVPTEALLNAFQQKVSEPISEAKVKADSSFLVAYYSDRGYPKMRLENRLLLSVDKTRATIEYRIQEGEQILVDRIVTSGNYRTKRSVVRESILFGEDTPFSLRRLAQSQGRLYSMNVFDRVDMDVPRPDNLEKFQNVFIRLKESKPYTVSYGVGYQTFDRVRGVLSISNRNLFGTARLITLRLRAGFKERSVLINYKDPHLFSHRVTSEVTAVLEHRDRRVFSFDRLAFSLLVERKLRSEREYLQVGEKAEPLKSLFVRYDFEDIDTFGTPSLSPEDRQFLAIHISSVSFGAVRDARDNIIDPHGGTYLSSALQVALSLLGSGTDFLKSFSQAQYYHPLKTTVLATSLRVGLAKGLKDTNALTISQRFFAGGGRTIRGFELDTAGPLDEDGEPVGGNMLFIINLEYRFPILGSLGGVVFFDYGNVFPFISDFTFQDLRKTTGLGLRYNTPIGPLTLDWGYKLDRRLEPIRESPWEFFISVGHSF